MPSEPRGLEIEGLTVQLAGRRVLLDVDLQVHPGEIVALLGPSGCGKSTFLAAISGLLEHRGSIRWDGREVSALAPERRRFGLMFQEYALFPHLDVRDNLAFGPRMAGLEARRVSQRVHEMAALLGIAPLLDRSVDSLSGGERQRVALARVLAPPARLVMLDEPLGSLDRPLRERLIRELPALLHGEGHCVLYVTHDLDEAASVADRMAVMSPGRIEQVGAPQQILQRPATRYVADFLGMHNLLPGVVTDPGPPLRVRTPLGNTRALDAVGKVRPVGAAVVLLLPKEAASAALPPPDTGLVVQGALQRVSMRGGRRELHLLRDGHTLSFFAPRGLPGISVGDSVRLGVDLQDATVVETMES